MGVVSVSLMVHFPKFFPNIKEHRKSAYIVGWRLLQIIRLTSGLQITGDIFGHFFNFEEEVTVYSKLIFEGDVPSHRLEKVYLFIDKVQELADRMTEALFKAYTDIAMDELLVAQRLEEKAETLMREANALKAEAETCEAEDTSYQRLIEALSFKAASAQELAAWTRVHVDVLQCAAASLRDNSRELEDKEGGHDVNHTNRVAFL